LNDRFSQWMARRIESVLGSRLPADMPGVGLRFVSHQQDDAG